MKYLRRNGQKDVPHKRDYSFTEHIDGDKVIEFVADGVEVSMTLREWVALAVRDEQLPLNQGVNAK